VKKSGKMIDRTDRLSDYLDGEMSGDEVAKLETALAGDSELRRVLQDLRAVRETAASLPPSSPVTDLWPGIEARIREERQPVVRSLAAERGARRRLSFTVPQLAAAAVAMLVLGSASVWVAMSSRGAGGDDDPIALAPASGAAFVATSGDASPFSYEATVEDLEEQLRIGRDRLDPKTVAALEGSLATIDRAIERAQEALEADPASVYLNRHLADARTRKIQVLQQAARLASS